MSAADRDGSGAQLQVTPPKRLRAGMIFAMSAFGLVLFVPVLWAMLVVSVRPLSLQSFVLPLVTIGLATYFLPFGFGNPLVVSLVKTLRPAGRSGHAGFAVQLTMEPRIRDGWRALLEDADDLGWLEVTDRAVRFYGDSVQLVLPFQHIREVRLHSAGWRGLFICGHRVELELAGLSGVESFEVAERASWVLPASRRTAQQLYATLKERRPA